MHRTKMKCPYIQHSGRKINDLIFSKLESILLPSPPPHAHINNIITTPVPNALNSKSLKRLKRKREYLRPYMQVSLLPTLLPADQLSAPFSLPQKDPNRESYWTRKKSGRMNRSFHLWFACKKEILFLHESYDSNALI